MAEEEGAGRQVGRVGARVLEVGEEGVEGQSEEGGLRDGMVSAPSQERGGEACQVARWALGEGDGTRVIQVCSILFVRNQCVNVPSGGIMCGYRFVFCSCFSASESAGPGYARGFVRRREGCEGGLNFSGFSRTRGLLGWVEAWRRPLDAGAVALGRRRRRKCCWLRRDGAPRGRRKRGTGAVADMLSWLWWVGRLEQGIF